MRILICDDDTLIIEQLKKYIESYFESNHLKCPELVSFTSGEALLTDKGEKDIVFLDIEMPGMNGIYVGNELKKANRNVIVFVVTSYSEYLDEAMRFHVFRYLPYNPNLKAVNIKIWQSQFYTIAFLHISACIDVVLYHYK